MELDCQELISLLQRNSNPRAVLTVGRYTQKMDFKLYDGLTSNLILSNNHSRGQCLPLHLTLVTVLCSVMPYGGSASHNT